MSEQGKTPSASMTTVTKLMMPMDASVSGNVFGGTILKLIDEVGSIAAVRHARKNIVTASVDQMNFLAPVHVGDLLRVIASVNYVHKTSMEIGVRVEAEDPLTGKIRHTGTCYLTCVSLDKYGRPTPVPTLIPDTEQDKRHWAEAEVRRDHRLQHLGKK